VILAGDIGGTKTALALADPRDPARVIREQAFPSARYGSLEAIVDEFLASERPPLFAAAFGVAGPIEDGVANITNLPWTIDTRALSGKLGAPVSLLNDVQATALGMLGLPATSFVELQPGRARDRGTIAVIAPGTGIGTSLLVWAGDRYLALPSEAGHADFAPNSDDEVELWRFLRARHGGHVSVERVVCGSGIVDLYAYARTQRGDAEPAWLTEALASSDRAAVIGQAALADRDPACVHAIALFAATLGAEAGNAALRGLAHGGVIIGGGIPPKLLPALQHGSTIERFCAKGRFEPWLRSLPVRICLDSRAALVGAVHSAVQIVATKEAP